MRPQRREYEHSTKWTDETCSDNVNVRSAFAYTDKDVIYKYPIFTRLNAALAAFLESILISMGPEKFGNNHFPISALFDGVLSAATYNSRAEFVAAFTNIHEEVVYHVVDKLLTSEPIVVKRKNTEKRTPKAGGLLIRYTYFYVTPTCS